MNLILQNIILGISLAAPIGPATTAIIKNGLRHGFLSAFKVALGVIAADTTFIFLVYFGLAYFITLPFIKISLWILGAIVLFYLGYLGIKEAFTKITIEQQELKGKNLFLMGYLINISNPLSIVWWLGVFGSIYATSNEKASHTQALLYSLTIIVGILLWHTFLALATHYGNKIINKNFLKYVSFGGGLIMIGFACHFVYNVFFSR